MATATDVRRITPLRADRIRRTALTLLGPAAFVLSQWRLNTIFWHGTHASVFAHGYVVAPGAELRWISANVVPDLLVYAGLAGAGLVLVALGYRFLWCLPAVLFATLPIVGAAHAPQFIGTGWWALVEMTGRHSWFGNAPVSSGADLALVLAPAAAWVGTVSRRPHRSLGMTGVLAVAVVTGVVGIALRTAFVVSNSLPEVGMVAAVCTFALLASTSRPWWPWATVLVAGLVCGLIQELLVRLGIAHGRTSVVLGTTPREQIVVTVCAVVVSCWEPLSTAMRGSEESPLGLLIAVNVLNVADAALTQFAIRAGQATELNPLVRSIGLPAKIVGVGLLSWLLYRKRPALLLIPAAALLLVLAYHVSGLVIDT